MDLSGLDITTLEKLANSSNLVFMVAGNTPFNNFLYTSNVKNILGYSEEEITRLPENHYSLIVEEDIENVKKILVNLESKKLSSCNELYYRIKTEPKKTIWLKEILCIDKNADGKEIGRFSTISDATKLKQDEFDANQQIISLKELNANKDKFISIVSHDLRAPFTTLLGFSEILINEKDITEEEQIEYLQYIYDSSKSQLDYINCLLDWSRLQTGRVKVEPVRLNVKNAVANAVAPLTGAAVRKNIDIKVDINPDLYMNADERLIGQAIIHLANNAIKFSPEEKTVFISSSRFKEGMVEIIVRDEGMGIAEENQSKLFRIDQKLVLPGTNGEKGSGMGLTLTKEIIEKHGGQVWFYSQVDEGSEFHITIPEAKNCVLIVEDEPAVLSVYKKVIESNFPSFEIKTATNGYEAIRVVREVVPTMIITDHVMPLMDGIQLIEEINKRDVVRNIPVIVISAKLNDRIIKSYSKLGVEKIIAKPADIEKLIDYMKDVLFRT
jgi:signal transduction histidine kinase/CheY-like chemotaxis protein